MKRRYKHIKDPAVADAIDSTIQNAMAIGLNPDATTEQLDSLCKILEGQIKGVERYKRLIRQRNMIFVKMALCVIGVIAVIVLIFYYGLF